MRGRPSRDIKASDKRVSARLSTNEYNALESTRELYEMSKSDFVREAILYYTQILQNKKASNA